MEFTAPINRLALGLLGTLDVKQLGKNPWTIESKLQTTLETWQFYTVGTLQKRASSAINIAAVGATVTDLVVPQNKLWLVTSVFVAIPALGAGQALVAHAAVFGPATGNTLLFAGPASAPYATGDTPLLTAVPIGQYLLCPPGTAFGIFTTRLTAGPVVNAAAGAAFLEVDV